MIRKRILFSSFILLLASCAGPRPGPDKQFAGAAGGAISGAGAGAVTGFQVGAGTGAGALVGAGVGAVAGSIRGAVQDTEEEQMAEFGRRTAQARARSWSQAVLQEQFDRRLDLHPTREIYPADLFFRGDLAALRPEAVGIVQEIARLNKRRMPWAKLVIASYARGKDGEEYPHTLAKRRALVIFNQLVQAGIEPRRLEARAVLLDGPILLDPLDDPLRYNQAIEIIAVDR
jgi:outer membrane protein OmpA-like peptidoglycan-associated protein